MSNNPGDSSPGQQEFGEAPASDAGASPSTDDVEISEPLAEIAKETIQTKDKHLGRQEWTRRALIIGFFVLFLVVFCLPAYAALQSDDPYGNVFELVKYFAPFVTALGGYIAGHYFPAQNPPQVPGGEES